MPMPCNIYSHICSLHPAVDHIFLSKQGEKECPFYMRNGSCGYGAGCRFHHPDPTSVGGADAGNSTLGGYSVGQFNHSSGNFDSGYSMGQPAQAAYYSPMVSDMTGPYQNNCSSYMPSMALLPQGVAQSREWNGHQVFFSYCDESLRGCLVAPQIVIESFKIILFTFFRVI